MHTKKLFVIGSITTDFYYQGKGLPVEDNNFHFHLGEKYHSDRFAVRIGGGGANVAITARLHEVDCELISVYGKNSFAQLQLQDMGRYGIKTKYLVPCADYNNVSTILLGETGERTVINYRTPHCQQKALLETIQKIAAREKAGWFYFGGNIPDIPLTEKALLFHYLSSLGHKIALNLSALECEGGLDSLRTIFANTHLLIQNRSEMAKIFHIESSDINLKSNLHPKLNYLKGELVVTADSEGAYWYERDSIAFQDALKVDKIVDTTGAGDAFSGALMSAIIHGKNPKDALELATKYAGKKLGNFGAH